MTGRQGKQVSKRVRLLALSALALLIASIATFGYVRYCKHELEGRLDITTNPSALSGEPFLVGTQIAPKIEGMRTNSTVQWQTPNIGKLQDDPAVGTVYFCDEQGKMVISAIVKEGFFSARKSIELDIIKGLEIGN